MSSSSKTCARKSRGRQKVNMAKMENQNNLQVTFSKRRAGLFKKASELCTLCGSEAAIVVFSPTQKAYSFGHPNVESIVNRYLTGISPAPHNTINQLIIDAHRDSTIRNLNLELTQVESMLALEKRRGEELDLMRRAGEMQKWIPTENDVDELDFEQLSIIKNAVLNFKKNLDVEVQKGMNGLANSIPFNPLPKGNEENPREISFGVGSTSNVSHDHVPTFGSNGFNYPNAGTGSSINNSDFYTSGRV